MPAECTGAISWRQRASYQPAAQGVGRGARPHAQPDTMSPENTTRSGRSAASTVACTRSDSASKSSSSPAAVRFDGGRARRRARRCRGWAVSGGGAPLHAACVHLPHRSAGPSAAGFERCHRGESGAGAAWRRPARRRRSAPSAGRRQGRCAARWRTGGSAGRSAAPARPPLACRQRECRARVWTTEGSQPCRQAQAITALGSRSEVHADAASAETGHEVGGVAGGAVGGKPSFGAPRHSAPLSWPPRFSRHARARVGAPGPGAGASKQPVSAVSGTGGLAPAAGLTYMLQHCRSRFQSRSDAPCGPTAARRRQQNAA